MRQRWATSGWRVPPSHPPLRAAAWLLRRGLDWGVLNSNGHSCLHKSALKGQTAVCRWLLDCVPLGLAHMQPDGDGNTPESFARAEGFAELADELEARRRLLMQASGGGASELY